MIATLVLAAALQVPTNVPADAEVIYPVMPKLTTSAGVVLSQSIQGVTATLTKDEVSYDVLALYKNTTNMAGTATLELKFESWRSGFGQAIKVEALWSDQLVAQTKATAVQSLPEKGQLGTYTISYTLPVKKQATHSLKLKFKLPIGVSGVDREERMVAYRVTNIGQAQALSQFRMAVKFDPSLVFAPIESKPDWGWQVGAEGAYLKLDGRPSDSDAVLTFRYYPPSFD
jgi:hypothetical protein